MNSLLKNNPVLFWCLVASIFIVSILGFSIYFFLLFKSKKINKKITNNEMKDTIKEINDKNSNLNKALNRADAGKLLWDLKNEMLRKKISIIDDISLEFIINTIIRNNYKSILFSESLNAYEAITIATKTSAKVYIDSHSKNALEVIKRYKQTKNIKYYKNEKVDFVIMNDKKNKYKDYFTKLDKINNKNSLFLIYDIKNLLIKKEVKELIHYIKLLDYRFEKHKIGKQFMLITK